MPDRRAQWNPKILYVLHITFAPPQRSTAYLPGSLQETLGTPTEAAAGVPQFPARFDHELGFRDVAMASLLCTGNFRIEGEGSSRTVGAIFDESYRSQCISSNPPQ